MESGLQSIGGSAFNMCVKLRSVPAKAAKQQPEGSRRLRPVSAVRLPVLAFSCPRMKNNCVRANFKSLCYKTNKLMDARRRRPLPQVSIPSTVRTMGKGVFFGSWLPCADLGAASVPHTTSAFSRCGSPRCPS